MTDALKYLKEKEVLWETYIYNGIVDFIVVTEGNYREEYILLQICNGKRKEIKRSNNPTDFHKIIKKKREKLYGI